MTMSTTVLIASPEHLSALRQGDLRDALAFSGNDTLAALDVIKGQRVSIVALEDSYAATARGRALMARIHADPALRECEIRIVAHVVETAAPLPVTDRRGAPRFKVTNAVEVRFDGRRALLLDVSLSGAQVISASSLRPSQRGKFTLIDSPRQTTRMPCGVAWVALELVGGVPRYRAGIEFSNPDTTTVHGFIDILVRDLSSHLGRRTGAETASL